MENITAAGNTEVPAYLTLRKLGFRIDRRIQENGDEVWCAENENGSYSAPSPLEVLGIYTMRQVRGDNWKAEDEEIDQYLAAYYSDGSVPGSN